MDFKTAPGFAILPTHGRASTNLPRFFKAAITAGMTIPGYLIVDEAEYAAQYETYDALDLPDNWQVHLVKGGCCAAATEEALRDLMEDDTAWVMWLADDLIPETVGWDRRVVEALTGWNTVSTDDGRHAPAKFNGATAWSGDLIRAVGYLYPKGLRHFYIDTAWEELGRMLNNWTVLMDVMVRHAHASWTLGAADATTAHIHKESQADERAFLIWKNTERLAAANRIGQVMVDYGVSKALPDLSHIHLMIATPCGSGGYERLYTAALFATIETLRQCKATVNFAEIPYCSDITLARNKLFGMFLRSGATHLFSVDDDMGWAAADVMRLLEYKRDFVAVAGPRKVFPPSFAVQNTSEQGLPLPLRQEAESGLFEVSDIGFAFAVVTREACMRVAAAHPELEFIGEDGRVEYGVFNPIIANRRYKSEDYAFCHRWRGAGGKIYVDPMISLKHVGSFVWEGAWYPQLLADAAEQRRAA